jgi:hypothetical protein
MESIKSFIGTVKTTSGTPNNTNSSTTTDYTSSNTAGSGQSSPTNKYANLKRADSENYFYIM